MVIIFQSKVQNVVEFYSNARNILEACSAAKQSAICIDSHLRCCSGAASSLRMF